MRFNAITASLAIGLSLGLSAISAQAATYSANTEIGTAGYTWGNVTLPNFSTTPSAADTFTDTFDFSLVSGSTGALTGLLTGFWGTGPSDASVITFTLKSGAGTESDWTTVARVSPTANIASGGYSAAAGFSGLTAGTPYHLVVNGNWAQNLGSETPTGSGVYAYQLQIAAVPEPETYAMFAAGLLFLGALKRRSKKEGA